MRGEKSVVDGRYDCKKRNRFYFLMFRKKGGGQPFPGCVHIKWKHEFDGGSGEEGGKEGIHCAVNVV